MTTPAPFPGDPGIPGLDLGGQPTAAPRYPRHALGLPAGSVRALLAFMVLGVLWLLVYASKAGDKVPVAYVYLQYVMILILAHYFASHGSTIGKHVSHRNPLYMPSGSVRFLLLAGYLGLVVWLLYNKREFEEPPSGPLVLPLVLMSGFFLGFLITKMVRTAAGGELPFWFQDLEAWVALLGMLGLLIIVMVRVFVNPGINEDIRLDLTTLETGVATVVGFYFGARS